MIIISTRNICRDGNEIVPGTIRSKLLLVDVVHLPAMIFIVLLDHSPFSTDVDVAANGHRSLRKMPELVRQDGLHF